jgi:MoaA/NifB/PqqE/SkfB family radical SAM enzyme
MRDRDEPLPAPEPAADKLAVWEFAGLLLTYWCNARCAFCYVYSAPERGGRMRITDALKIWSSLDQLAAKHGKKMRIHLSGGEPFGDWPHVLSLVRAARVAGLTPLEKVETNAFWASSDGITRARLEQLDALGMERLVVSTDVYHQEFIPFERVRRCVEIARQVLGRQRVRVRWWDFFKQPLDTHKLNEVERRRAYAEALRRHQDRLTGRAADRLAEFLPRHPAEHFRGGRCIREVLGSRHVHVDPYGNVFPGVCNGIILGNAFKQPPEELWECLAANWREHPVVSAVVAGGSYELMRNAKAFGYRELERGYANKCHLCHHVRQFLRQGGIWPEHIGPAECYASDRELAPLNTAAARGSDDGSQGKSDPSLRSE